MPAWPDLATRLRHLLPGLWVGLLLTVAGLATPAPFALLMPADAGRVVARMLSHEAHVSLVLGALVLLLERFAARRSASGGQGRQFTPAMLLALGALFCTVAGYFALQPLMVAAKAGQGVLSFGQLHALSAAFFLVKVALILALAWRAGRQS
jgi:Domain of unknown function (DUF4149)